VAVALSVPAAAVNVSVYEPASLRLTFLLNVCTNLSPDASVTTCVCVDVVPAGPASVFVSVRVSVADDVFVRDSVAVAVVPATTTSGYDTDTVNEPLGDEDESDDATAAPVATTLVTSTATASVAKERRNDFKRTTSLT